MESRLRVRLLAAWALTRCVFVATFAGVAVAALLSDTPPDHWPFSPWLFARCSRPASVVFGAGIWTLAALLYYVHVCLHADAGETLPDGLRDAYIAGACLALAATGTWDTRYHPDAFACTSHLSLLLLGLYLTRYAPPVSWISKQPFAMQVAAIALTAAAALHVYFAMEGHVPVDLHGNVLSGATVDQQSAQNVAARVQFPFFFRHYGVANVRRICAALQWLQLAAFGRTLDCLVHSRLNAHTSA